MNMPIREFMDLFEQHVYVEIGFYEDVEFNELYAGRISEFYEKLFDKEFGDNIDGFVVDSAELTGENSMRTVVYI